MLEIVLIYLVAGALAGFVSGLWGVGGAFTMAPALIFVLPLQGAPDAHIMHLTIGTALAVTALTSAWVALLRWRAGDLRFPLLARFVPFVAAGALLGATVGDALPNLVLKLVFIFFIGLTVVRGVLQRRHAAAEGGGDFDRVRGPALWGTATTAGFTGSLLGPGPAIIIAPFLRRHRYPMPVVSATASALAALLAFTATVGYVYGGFDAAGLPHHSVGYLYLPAFAGLVVGAFAGSPLGIRVSHRVPDRLLHQSFIAYLALLLVVMVVQTVRAGA